MADKRCDNCGYFVEREGYEYEAYCFLGKFNDRERVNSGRLVHYECWHVCESWVSESEIKELHKNSVVRRIEEVK